MRSGTCAEAGEAFPAPNYRSAAIGVAGFHRMCTAFDTPPGLARRRRRRRLADRPPVSRGRLGNGGHHDYPSSCGARPYRIAPEGGALRIQRTHRRQRPRVETDRAPEPRRQSDAASAAREHLPEGVVCTMRGIDFGDRPAPQLPHRVLEIVSQNGEGSTHARFTAGSQAVRVGSTDLDRLGP